MLLTMWVLAQSAVGCFYVATFLFGLNGNLFVFFIVFKLRFLSSPGNSYWAISMARRSMLYILILAAADLLVLSTAPLSFLFLLEVNWEYGSLLCRLHCTIDIAGKLFSVVTLTCISVERYCGIRYSWRQSSGKNCINIVPLSVGITVCVAVPAVPWAMYTDSLDVPYPSDHNATLTMCINMMPDDIFFFAMSYLLFFGFILPLGVMSVCYCLLIRHVKKRYHRRLISSGASKIVQEPHYVCELTRSVLRVSAFHFICWTPFWFFTFVPPVIDYFELDYDDSLSWMMNARLVANLLPYVNSSGNWIFYAALNRDIRKRIEEDKRRTRSQNGKPDSCGSTKRYLLNRMEGKLNSYRLRSISATSIL